MCDTGFQASLGDAAPNVSSLPGVETPGYYQTSFGRFSFPDWVRSPRRGGPHNPVFAGWPIQSSAAPRFAVFEAWAGCCRNLEILTFSAPLKTRDLNLLLPSALMPSLRKPRRPGQPPGIVWSGHSCPRKGTGGSPSLFCSMREQGLKGRGFSRAAKLPYGYCWIPHPGCEVIRIFPSYPIA